MEVQRTNLESFMSQGKSALDLISEVQGKAGQNALNQPITPADQNQPVVTELPINKTAEELLGLDAKKEGEGAPKVEDKTEEPKEGEPAKEEDQQPADAPKEKAGRPSNKLPEGFSTLVEEAEKKGVLFGFEDGKYETIEDFVELIKQNDEIKKEQIRQEALQNITDGLNPAMKAVLEYAKMGVQSPQEMIPFLTAVDNLQYTATLDPKVPEHQIEIIRNALTIQGLSHDDITNEIKELSEVEGKLEKRAAALKPTLDRYNQTQIEKIYQEQARAHQEEAAWWQNHEKAVKQKILDNQTISGFKMRKEHKQLAYSALAQPDPSLGNTLPIYAIIDNLIDKGQYELLAEIVLLGLDKKSYYNYVGASVAETQAEQAQRALRTNLKSTPVEAPTNDQPVQRIKRNISNKLSLS